MAASMQKLCAVRQIRKLVCSGQTPKYIDLTFRRQMGWINSLSSLKDRFQTAKPKEAQKEVVRVEEPKVAVEDYQDGRRKGIEEHKPYKPPENLLSVIESTAADIYGDQKDLGKIKLDNRYKKFIFLTQLIEDLDHDIPNMDLHLMETVDDVINYFSTEIRDTSAYEDLAKLDLPKNLHMNLEPIRFHPDTDTIYGGKTAFPGRKTVITSVKYKRKYKDYDGGDPVNSPSDFKY